MQRRRAAKCALWAGIPVLLIVAIIVFWNWDWFIPLIDSRASADIGRPVTMTHLHIRLGRVTRVVADDIVIGNPPQWAGPPFATAKHLVVQVNLWDEIFHHRLILPLIALQDPRVDLVQTSDGKTNYELQLASGGSGNANEDRGVADRGWPCACRAGQAEGKFQPGRRHRREGRQAADRGHGPWHVQ